MALIVLRLNHRKKRDKRVSTHVGLVARAFGADEIIYSGEEDKKLLKSVKKVCKEWGGKFRVRYRKNWEKIIENFKGKIIHLTMYGLPIEKEIGKIRKNKNLIVIVGASKVPGKIYQEVDYNIAVTNQPHSEIAALSIFFDRYFKGKELEKKFVNWKIRVVPQKRGKKINKRK